MTSAETHVSFPSGALRLEGRLQRRAGTRGAIICHPHPLYGGDMNSPVVTTAAGAFAAAGYSVLRFNFRGTGASEGRHGKGIDERDDALSAVSFLQQEAGAKEVWLAGYSFGAFVIAQLPQGMLPPGQRVLIAPPVEVMDFSSVERIAGLILVVTGSLDELAPSDRIAKELPRWNDGARLEVLPGADHFFSGHLRQLEAALTHHLA